TVQWVDAIALRATTSQRDAAGNRFGKQVAWVGAGAPDAVDGFAGGCATVPACCAQSRGFGFETVVRPEETTRDHFVRVKAGSSIRAEIRFQGVSSGTAYIQRQSGSSRSTHLLPH